MPRDRNDFCPELAPISESELYDNFMNLKLSACYMRHLMIKYNSIPQAMLAYHSGPNNKVLKDAKHGRLLPVQASNYLSAAWLRSDQIRGGVCAHDLGRARGD